MALSQSSPKSPLPVLVQAVALGGELLYQGQLVAPASSYLHAFSVTSSACKHLVCRLKKKKKKKGKEE